MYSRNPFRSIGEIYLDSSFFADEDEGAKTIGQVAIGENAVEILMNRRKVKGRLNDAGYAELKKAIDQVKKIYPDNEVKVTWDKYCGCSMCPCSPGYRIKVNAGMSMASNGKYRFSLHVSKEKGKVKYHFFRPKDSWNIGYDKAKEIESAFSHGQEIGV